MKFFLKLKPKFYCVALKKKKTNKKNQFCKTIITIATTNFGVIATAARSRSIESSSSTSIVAVPNGADKRRESFEALLAGATARGLSMSRCADSGCFSDFDDDVLLLLLLEFELLLLFSTKLVLDCELDFDSTLMTFELVSSVSSMSSALLLLLLLLLLLSSSSSSLLSSLSLEIILFPPKPSLSSSLSSSTSSSLFFD